MTRLRHKERYGCNLNANANFARLHDKNNWCGYVAKTSVERVHAKTSASIVPLTTSTSIASLPTLEPIQLQRQVLAITLLPS